MVFTCNNGNLNRNELVVEPGVSCWWIQRLTEDEKCVIQAVRGVWFDVQNDY